MPQHPLSGARRRYPIGCHLIERRAFWLFGPKRLGFVIEHEDGTQSRPVGRFKTFEEADLAAEQALYAAQARYLADMERR